MIDINHYIYNEFVSLDNILKIAVREGNRFDSSEKRMCHLKNHYLKDFLNNKELSQYEITRLITFIMNYTHHHNVKESDLASDCMSKILSNNGIDMHINDIGLGYPDDDNIIIESF